MSSVMRCIARLPEIIWTRPVENGLNVLIYNTGELEAEVKSKAGKELDIKLSVETDYPNTGRIKITLSPTEPAKFNLGLRVPSWCPKFSVLCNGDKSYKGETGSMLNIDREWRSGDVLQINMDMNDRFVEGDPMYAGYYAFVHGPLVFALDEEINPGIDVEKIELGTIDVNKIKPIPEKLPEDWIGDLAYAVPAAGNDGKDLIFIPFLDAGQHGSMFAVWVKFEE
jgi:DUF1680 family protein